MRRTAFPTAFLLACGCAHGPAAGPADPAPPPPPLPPAGCGIASVMVVRDVATALAVDPVETQREVMLSDSFRKQMARTAPHAVGHARLKVTRKGRSAVLELVTAAASPADALAACGAALEASLTFGKEALEFLQQQGVALEAQRTSRIEALREFELANDLVARPVKARLAAARERALEADRLLADPKSHVSCKPSDAACIFLLDTPLKARLNQAREDARLASELELDWSRRAREVEEIEARLVLVRSRLAEATVAGILQQDVRILDPCAPCRHP